MLDLITQLRLAYLSAAAAVLFIYLTPPLRSRLLAYGPRATSPSKTTSPSTTQNVSSVDKRPSSFAISVLDQVAALTVPHSYFTSFYYVSTLLSIFWASQLISRGPAFRAVSAYCEPRNEHDSVSFDRVLVTWTLMLAQGSRRLYESLTLSGPSKSRMWVGHWVLGLAYYAGASIAVWVEGISVLQSHEYSLSDLTIKAPSLRSIVAILIFILASGLQHDCHAYLFSLKTKTKSKSEGGEYTLPTHPAFTRIIVPHYTAECLVYLALALIAAPSSSWGLNGTLACVLVFVVVNLGVTAEGTREWYVQKFGHDKIAGRWRMLPGVW